MQQLHQRATVCPGELVDHFDAQHGLLTLRRTVAGTSEMIWVQATPTAVVNVVVGASSAPAPTVDDVRQIALIAVRKAEATS